MNSVNLIGRLTAKPTFGYTNSNIAYAKFTLAVNRNFKNANGERQADFINCVAYRKTAELINQYMVKGDLLGAEGRIQTGSYTASDGSKRYTTDVVADSVQFLDTKRESQARAQTPYDYQDAPTPPTNNVDVDNDPFADFGDNVAIDDNFLD